MDDPAIELRPAVLALLKADDGLKAQMGGVVRAWDWPPTNAQEPYLVCASLTVDSVDAEGYDGTDATVTITAWSRTKGPPGLAEAAALNGLVVKAMARLADLKSYRVQTVRAFKSQTLFDLDGETAKGVTQFEIATEPS